MRVSKRACPRQNRALGVRMEGFCRPCDLWNVGVCLGEVGDLLMFIINFELVPAPGSSL